MSVDHFFTKENMGDIKEIKITAINIYQQNLVVGDSSGNVSSFEITTKNKLTLVKQEFLQKSKVEEIITLPNQSVCFALCQGEISVLLIPSLTKKGNLKIKEPIEKIFYNKEDKECENQLLCITKKKKVKIIDFDPKTYNLTEQQRQKDIYVEDFPICAVWVENNLVYAYGSKISWMDLTTGKQNPVDFDGAVQLMSLGGKIGLTNKEMVLFMKDGKAFSFNPILHNAKDFIWFVEYKNYLIGLYKKNIEILRKGEQDYRPVESIELDNSDGQGKFIISSKSKVVIITEAGQGLNSFNVINLKERPCEQQIEVLINKSQFDSALEKLIENIPEDDDKKIDKVESFFLDCAFACVDKRNFDLALKYISLTNFNPFEFIYMFFDTLSVNIIHGDKKKSIIDNRSVNQLLKIESSEDEAKKVYTFLMNILMGKRDYILAHFKFPEEESKKITFLSSKLAKINLSDSTTDINVQKTLDAINSTLIKSMIKLKKSPKDIESVLDNKSVNFSIFDEFVEDQFFTDDKNKDLNETRFTLAYIQEKKGNYETALEEWERFGSKKEEPGDKLPPFFSFEARDRTKKIFYKFKDTKSTDRIRKENLFRKHIKWLLRKYPNEAFEVAIKTELVGIKVFMDEIIPDVEKESQDSKIESGKLKELFLEYCNQNQQTENYQTQLLELYAEKMFCYVKKDEPKLNLNLEGDLKKYYESFMKIIKDPESCYNKKTILEYIEKSWLREATLYLYSQLKEHDKALTELFNNAKLNNSFKEIEDYCTENLKAKPDIFQNFYKLLSDIVKNDCQGQIDKNLAEIETIDRDLITRQQEHITEGEKKEANEKKERLKEEIQRMEELKKPYEKEMLKILKDYGTIENLDPLFALNYADDHWNICDNNEFYNYLQNVVREYTIEGNKYKIGKNLSEMGLIYKEKEAIDFKNKSVTIDSEKTCDLCKKKIGNTIFVVYPNLRVYHVKCAGNQYIDPMTGVDFSKKKFM